MAKPTTTWRALGAAWLLAAACSAGAPSAGDDEAGGARGGSMPPPSASGGAGGRGGTAAGGQGGAGAGGAERDAGAPDRAAAAVEPDAGGTPLPAPDAQEGASDASDAAVPAGERSAGCGTTGGLPEGPATIQVGNATRSYVLRLPAGYSSDRAWPLVLALHPNGGSGVGYWDGTGGARPLRALLKDKAILVLPVARPEGGGFDWRGDLPADIAYFDALIGRLEGKLCIDTRRIFSMGFSGGASFSGVLGCVRTDIRAIATAGAVAYYDAKTCVGKPAAWVAIGAGELIPAREQFRDFWRARAGCQAQSTPVAPAACIAYACPAPTPVHYCPHPGGHEWPAFGTQAAVSFFLGL
jgi:polyhydroxybutyrate depolymerase